MISMGALPDICLLIFFIAFLSILWGGVFIIALQHRTGVKFNKRFGLGLLLVIDYLIIQVLFAFVNSDGGIDEKLIEIYQDVTLIDLFFVLAVILTFFMYYAFDYKSWTEKHVTNMSIKESVDKLPSGICIYTENGVPVLVNPAADRISVKLLGEPITNGLHLSENLPPAGGLVPVDDDHIYSVEQSKMDIDGIVCREIVFSDVTKEYKVNRLLEDRNVRLARMNDKLQELNRTIDAVTIESEVLDAKVRVHDSLGQVLLATRRYLEEQKEIAEAVRKGEMTDDPEAASRKINNLLEMWRESIGFISGAPSDTKKDEYDNIRDVARDVGINMYIDGILPVENPAKHIVATAMHECLTNTLKHAGGDEMRIRIRKGSFVGDEFADEFGADYRALVGEQGYLLEITNNGKIPEREIKEKGGLASLRQLVESAGGSMRISLGDRFTLSLLLPEDMI